MRNSGNGLLAPNTGWEDKTYDEVITLLESEPYDGLTVNTYGCFENPGLGKSINALIKYIDDVCDYGLSNNISYKFCKKDDIHKIRIIKNKVNDRIEFMGEVIEYEEPIIVGQVGSIDITYKLAHT